MQRQLSKWWVGLALVTLVLMIGMTVQAATPQPKLVVSAPDNVKAKQLVQKWTNKDWQNYMVRHIQDPAKREEAKAKFAKMADELKAKPEGVARFARSFTEGWGDAIATNGKVTAWSSDTAYGMITFAPANDIAHPTAYSPLDWAWAFTSTPMRFFGDYLYINEGGGYIFVYDCGDPNNIGYVGYYDGSCWGDGIDFDVHNGYLWQVTDDERFIAWKLGNFSQPVLIADPDHGSGNFASLAGYELTNIRVTDRCAITVDNNSGTVFLWDITNMVDPTQDVILYPAGGAGNPWIPNVGGTPFFQWWNYRPQFEMVQGYAFISNSQVTISNFGSAVGVTRVSWLDETSSDSFAAVGYNSVDDGGWGYAAKAINHFEVYGTGTFVYTAFDNQGDYATGATPYDGVAGRKWDWSDFLIPAVALNYKMDRFFWGYTQKVVGDTTATPIYLEGGGFWGYYGGASICFPPVTDVSGVTDAQIAGYNYIGTFSSAGHLSTHYTVGMDHWSDWFNTPNPAGATGRNVVPASDDSFILYWYNEGFTIQDPSNYGVRMGAWELPGRTDWVRNVALTNDNHYAMVAAGRYGLICVDLSDPTHPLTVGNWWTNPTTSTYDKQPVTYVFIPQEPNLARYAYVQTRVILADAGNAFINHNVLRVLDISNPPMPAEVDHWDGPTEHVFTNDPYGGYPLPNNFRTVWDINDIQLVKIYYGGSPRYWLQISNGQSGDWGYIGYFGFPFANYDPEYGNSFGMFAGPTHIVQGPVSEGTGQLILSEITVPATPTPPRAVSMVIPGDYAWSSCFMGLSNPDNYWSYVACYGDMMWVDMGDPASNPLNVQPVIAAGAFPTYTRVYTVPGFDQVLAGGPWDWYELWDVTAPLLPIIETTTGGMYYAFLSDGSWVNPRWYGDIGLYLNKLDYNFPTFWGGPANDGWISPIGASGSTLPAEFTLKVKVTDDVAVTRVRYYAAYGDGCLWDPNRYDDFGGAVYLGSATMDVTDGTWTLVAHATDIPGTAYIVLLAVAYDAGNNATTSAPNGWWHITNGGPQVTVSVYPTGTDGTNYIWSTVTISASVVNPPTATVQRVLFKVDGVSVGNGTYNPSTNLWYVNWNTTTYTDGNHVITAEATNYDGGVGVSAPVTKFVANHGPSSVLLTAPLSGSQVYGSAVPVSATVGDWPVPVINVMFFLDRPANQTTGGTLIGTATTGEGGVYSITWDTTGVVDGNHTIVAVATDQRWDGSMRTGNSTWISFAKITPAPLTATVVTSPALVTDITPVTAIATVGGGIAPYHYAWTVDGTAFGSDSASATTGLLTVGSHTIALTVTDSQTPPVTKDASVTIDVHPSIIPPVVSAVQKVNDASGFRLKVYGANFHQGCTVMINGVPVPNSVWKSNTQVNAKGGGLKSMVPKGVTVTITVKNNDDGGVSAGFSYTR